MSVAEQSAPTIGLEEYNARFEQADLLAAHYAQDPETIRAIEVESLPLVFGEQVYGAPVLVVACKQIASYAVGANYRAVSSTATFGLTKGQYIRNIVDAGPDWKNTSFVDGTVAFNSINELDYDLTADRVAILDREDDTRSKLKRANTDPLIEAGIELSVPGMRRIATMLDQVKSAKKTWERVGRTPSQSRADFESTKNFINHVGVGRVAVNNLVPVVKDLIEVNQERFYYPGQITAWIAPQDSRRKTIIEFGQDGDDHYQEETLDGKRTSRMDNGEALSEYLDGLELSTRSNPVGAKYEHNTPLAQRHLTRFLGHFRLDFA